MDAETKAFKRNIEASDVHRMNLYAEIAKCDRDFEGKVEIPFEMLTSTYYIIRMLQNELAHFHKKVVEHNIVCDK